jgi:hypothetical protein
MFTYNGDSDCLDSSACKENESADNALYLER